MMACCMNNDLKPIVLDPRNLQPSYTDVYILKIIITRVCVLLRQYVQVAF